MIPHTGIVWRSATAIVGYTEDVRMSNTVTKQLVANGSVRWFDLHEARIFLNTAPVGFLKCEALAVSDSGLCAIKSYSVWSRYDRGMWKKVYKKSAAVVWLIRHGHPIPNSLKAVATEMQA